MTASEILKLRHCAPWFVLGFFNQFCDCIGMTKPCRYYKVISFNTQVFILAGLCEPGGSGIGAGQELKINQEAVLQLLLRALLSLFWTLQLILQSSFRHVFLL